MTQILCSLSRPSSPLPPWTISSHSAFNLQLCNNPLLLLSDASQKSSYLYQVQGVEYPPTRWTRSVFWDHQISVPFQHEDRACWTVKLPLLHYNKCQTTSIPPLNLRLFLIHSSKCWGWCCCIQRPVSIFMKQKEVNLHIENVQRRKCVRLLNCCHGENGNKKWPLLWVNKKLNWFVVRKSTSSCRVQIRSVQVFIDGWIIKKQQIK